LLRSPVKQHGRAPRFGVDIKQLERVDLAIARSFLQVVHGIRALGLEVVPVQLPDAKAVSEVHATLVLRQAREVYADLWPLAASQLGGDAHRALGIAQGIDDAAMTRATRGSRAIIESLNAIFISVDAVLTPTLPVDVPASGARSVMVNGNRTPVVSALTSQTCIANVTGCPAAVLPVSGEFLPGGLSVQLLAPHGGDAALLGYCLHLEKMLPQANTLLVC
jgi:Asp-tRNA(Asn)/Glu-tRNA(Gln) amidotransferase A subunit family amidase